VFFSGDAIETPRMTFQTASFAPTSPSTTTSPAPSTSPAPARATSSCPWRIADPDGQTNVRPEAGTARPAIGTVPNGTTIVPLERRGRWWRIGAPLAGWIWAANVRQSCP
jgi:hypothetical protein